MAKGKIGETGQGKSDGRGKKYFTLHSKSPEKPQTTIFQVIADRLRSKPRMTRSDKWKKRPVIVKWYAWKDLVALSYRRTKGRSYVCPVAMSYEFYLKDKRRIDLDNLIKGINDALLGLAFADDDVKHIKKIDCAEAFIFPSLEEEKAIITIRPLSS